MPEVVSDALSLALEINRVRPGCGPVTSMDRLWEPMAKIAPFAAAWIGLADPRRRNYLTVTSAGHGTAALKHLESTDFYDEVQESDLVRLRGPVQLRGDRGLPLADRAWAGHCLQAGYRGGVALPLTARDGRRLGLLTLHTVSPAQPDDTAREMIAGLAPAISDAVDPMYVVAAVRYLITDAHAGVVVSPDRQTWPMPDLPSHAALAADSLVIRVALTHLAQQQTGSTFLCPWPCPGDPDALLRVTAFTCPHQLPSHFTALVVISEPGRLRALTRRELEVLGLLVEGWPNQQIAAALFVTERTVAAHLEHIRAKMNAPTRTVAAVEALRNGLYIPLELFEDQHRLAD